MDPGVRSAAAAALAAIAPAQAARTAAALTPFDPVALGVTARAAAPEARADLAASEPGRRLALPAMILAGETAPLLTLARSGTDAQARLDAIAALGRTGGDEAIALLGSLAFDKKAADLAARKAAYRAYRRAKRRAARADRGAAAPAAENGADE
jgi:ParB family chromosome partitioning protein